MPSKYKALFSAILKMMDINVPFLIASTASYLFSIKVLGFIDITVYFLGSSSIGMLIMHPTVPCLLSMLMSGHEVYRHFNVFHQKYRFHSLVCNTLDGEGALPLP